MRNAFLIKSMKNKEKNNFWKKIKFRYRFSAINENTLEEVWRIKTSVFSGAVIFLLLGLFLVSITATLIIATPIRYYLPGYLDVEIRNKSIQTALKIDSLEQKLLLNEEYIKNIKNVMLGTVPASLVTELDSAKQILNNNPNLGKSEIEKEFVSQYEDDAKYSLNILQNNSNPANVVFFNKPIKGAIVQKFDLEKNNYGLTINVVSSEPVLATSDGNIIYIGYDIDNKMIVNIQHKNGYTSIYKGLNEVSKKMGDTVKSGEAIGSVKVDTKSDAKNLLEFQLWNKGIATNPEQYILF